MDKKRKYLFQIEVEDGEIDNILHELEEAQRTIYRCYSRLSDLGVVVVKNKENHNCTYDTQQNPPYFKLKIEKN